MGDDVVFVDTHAMQASAGLKIRVFPNLTSIAGAENRLGDDLDGG